MRHYLDASLSFWDPDCVGTSSSLPATRNGELRPFSLAMRSAVWAVDRPSGAFLPAIAHSVSPCSTLTCAVGAAVGVGWRDARAQRTRIPASAMRIARSVRLSGALRFAPVGRLRGRPPGPACRRTPVPTIAAFAVPRLAEIVAMTVATPLLRRVLPRAPYRAGLTSDSASSSAIRTCVRTT